MRKKKDGDKEERKDMKNKVIKEGGVGYELEDAEGRSGRDERKGKIKKKIVISG